MADRFDSTAYKSSSGLEGEASNSSYRFNSGRSDLPRPAEQQPTGGNQSTISTLPDKKIDSQRQMDNTTLKFPEDLADDFYISFNAFKHSMERPEEARRSFTFEKSIVLPIPTNLSDSFAAGYNSTDLYIAGEAVREFASSSFQEKGIAGSVKYAFSNAGINKASEKVSDLLDAISGNPAVTKNAALTGGVYLAEGLNTISPGIAAAAKSSMQLSANPFPVMVFQGATFKPAFTFDWTLYPESRSEATNIKKIIGFFRREMLPERMETNTSLLRTPSIFEIKIRPKNIARTFKRCVLTNMGVNYAPNGPSFISDVTGNQEKFSSAVSISLTFQEIEVWLADDYSILEDNYFNPNIEFQI